MSHQSCLAMSLARLTVAMEWLVSMMETASVDAALCLFLASTNAACLLLAMIFALLQLTLSNTRMKKA